MALVIAKAIAGQEELHPVEMLWESIEIAGVFVAGLHASHWLHSRKEKDEH